MSGRSRRDTAVYDLDYSLLHCAGVKLRKSQAMDAQKLRVSEKQLEDDISENLNLYALCDLDNLDEVLEGLDIITDLGKSFRHLHIELQEALGNEYLGQYGDKVKSAMENIRKYQSEAKVKSKRLRQEETERSMAKVLADKRNQEVLSTKATLNVEFGVMNGKIDDEINTFNLTHSE